MTSERDPFANFERMRRQIDELFGDFSPGRFAWRLENVRAFKEPLSIRGKQGLFDVDDRIVQEAL